MKTRRISPYIIMIDDDIMKGEMEPLVEFVRIEYGESNVFLFADPDLGMEFIENNLSKRLIVLLDLRFNGKSVGFDVFERIEKQSSLVCFIVVTGSAEDASQLDLIKLINGHAWYLINRESDPDDILALVKEAEDSFALRVDCALEEWILRQSLADQKKPFITNRKGKPYSLLDILRAVRTGDDEIGEQTVASILTTAIDVLQRDKSRIGNE